MPPSLVAAQPNDVGELHASHHRWLVSWLRSRLGNPADAADVAQDVFLRLLRQPPLQALHEPRAYMATMASRLALNLQRRRRLETAYLAALAALPEGEVPSPEKQWLLRETLLEIDELLSALGWKVKRAFLLAQFDSMKYTEIAQDIGVTPRTVVTYVARAMTHCCLHARNE